MPSLSTYCFTGVSLSLHVGRLLWPPRLTRAVGVSFRPLAAPVLYSCRSPLTKKAHIQIKIGLDIFFTLIFVLVLLFNEVSRI